MRPARESASWRPAGRECAFFWWHQMYLKRLELLGFKSFLGKTAFEFGPGVTAIIGPNGSGKSNVAESLRWVLGEQATRNLRARRLEDVIFSGSSQKAAVGM